MHYILGLDRLENPILVHASLKSDAFSIKLPAAPSNFLFHAHCMSSPSASLEFAAQITADHMLAAFMTMCQILRSFAASSTLFPTLLPCCMFYHVMHFLLFLGFVVRFGFTTY
jgi:hypothetical protein